MKVTHSILLTGPSGVGKSSFGRKALEAVGSGLVLASPNDELDSYLGLEPPLYQMYACDDSLYLPSLTGDDKGTPTGLRDGVHWLRQRYGEVLQDVKDSKQPRYGVLVLDTVSAFGSLATNAAMHKYSWTSPPAAMSPDGAAYYTYLRQRQEELLRLARAFRGHGIHLIALCHVTESEVKETVIAKEAIGKTTMNMPAVPGAFRAMLPSFFSTVLYGGVMAGEKGKQVHYVQWKADSKRPTKNRFGALDTNDKLVNDWVTVTGKIEAAALKRLGS